MTIFPFWLLDIATSQLHITCQLETVCLHPLGLGLHLAVRGFLSGLPCTIAASTLHFEVSQLQKRRRTNLADEIRV